MTAYIVSSGSPLVSLTLQCGDTLSVLSGGVAEDITVSSGATETVLSGGLVVSTMVDSGGLEVVDSGGLGSADYIKGELALHASAVENKLYNNLGLVSGPGTLDYPNDYSNSPYLQGITSGATITSDVVLIGSAVDVLLASGAFFDSGFISGVVVEASANLYLSGGNVVDDITILSSGLVDDGLISGASIDAGVIWRMKLQGDLTITSGGLCEYSHIEPLVSETISAGGTGYENDVLGTDIVLAGGLSIAEAADGGQLFVYGVASGLKVSGLGTATIESGGVVERALAGNSLGSGTLVVLSGGTVYDSNVQGGCFEKISAGGDARTVDLEGEVVVWGSAYDVRVSSAPDYVNSGPQGYALIESGGVLSVGIASASAVVAVLSGGSAHEDVVESGGLQVVSAGGSASATVVRTGGEAVVYGSANVDYVSSGGSQTVESGGVDSAAMIYSGGSLTVSAGGSETGAVLISGGAAEVYGSAAGLRVSSGGALTMEAGGLASTTVLYAGGALIDDGTLSYAAGDTYLQGALTGSGAVVEDGPGVLVVSSASAFAGALTISGGTLDLAGSGGVGKAAETFAGSAVLEIGAADTPAAGATFASLLSGFSAVGEGLDLAGMRYAPGATATLDGSTLVLAEGGETYDFTLAGPTAAAYAVSDRGGGTFVAPTAVGAALVHAAAGFAAGNAPAAASGTRPVPASGVLVADGAGATASAHHG